jgi:hypothetical protein
MRNLFTGSLLLFILHTPAFTQPYNKGTLSVSLGGEFLFAESRLRNSHNTGFGGTLKGEYVFAKHAAATFAGGYYLMSDKKPDATTTQNLSAVPLKAGLRYYLGSFYASGETGVVFLTGYGSGTSLLWSAGIGDKFAINRRVFDIGIRHEAWTSVNNTNAAVVALRVAYEFAVNQQTTSNRAAF